uniref:Uncharacterized protein n=1 Tax=Nelumbo nucifera TaxID=4432 RepID=A0A822Y1B8_NELNU|nr:TPA_asm: hypothetical protein HUJ06_026775 [Nelumbo nucifera]
MLLHYPTLSKRAVLTFHYATMRMLGEGEELTKGREFKEVYRQLFKLV